MREQEVVNALESRAIIVREGHFVYTSGKHGREYIDKNALLADTALAGRLAHAIAMKSLEKGRGPWPQVVAGPAMSGAILAQLVALDFARASAMSPDEATYAAYAELDPDGRAYRLRRNFDKIVRGRRVLVVEDVVNSARSALGTAHAVIEAGGIVTGIAVIWNRSETDKIVLNRGSRTVEMPIISLVHRPFPSLTPAECREFGPCAEGVQINADLGHGANFLALDKPRC